VERLLDATLRQKHWDTHLKSKAISRVLKEKKGVERIATAESRAGENEAQWHG
jgi:hypothetical protein